MFIILSHTPVTHCYGCRGKLPKEISVGDMNKGRDGREDRLYMLLAEVIPLKGELNRANSIWAHGVEGAKVCKFSRNGLICEHWR